MFEWLWFPVKKFMPEPGLSVIVWEPGNRNCYMAWFNGKKWFEWNPREECSNALELEFQPSHWCHCPLPPDEKG